MDRVVVAAFYTDDFADKADRFAKSAIANDVRHIRILKVDAVHSSISNSGTPAGVTKAAFILETMEMFPQMSVMYCDIDMVFRSPPFHLEWGVKTYLYQWRKGRASDRLLTTGSVQVYAPSPGAKQFLKHWDELVRFFPRIEDDKMLDFAFNATSDRRRLLEPFAFLPEGYLAMPTHPKKAKQAFRETNGKRVLVHAESFSNQKFRRLLMEPYERQFFRETMLPLAQKGIRPVEAMPTLPKTLLLEGRE